MTRTPDRDSSSFALRSASCSWAARESRWMPGGEAPSDEQEEGERQHADQGQHRIRREHEPEPDRIEDAGLDQIHEHRSHEPLHNLNIVHAPGHHVSGLMTNVEGRCQPQQVGEQVPAKVVNGASTIAQNQQPTAGADQGTEGRGGDHCSGDPEQAVVGGWVGGVGLMKLVESVAEQ